MNDYLQRHAQIAVQLLVIACAIVIGSWVAHHNQAKVESEIAGHLDAQASYMYEIAKITDRNGADDAITAIIIDCPRRSEYESLLVKLGDLSKKDLLTVQNLSESCGNFYAERKALMVSKFERELEEYTSLIKMLEALNNKESKRFKLEKWNELLTLEKTRSSLLTDQETIQEKIISLLISGSGVQSSEVTTLVHEAQEIAQLLDVDDQQIDTLRENIHNN